MLELAVAFKINIREDIAHPARSVQYVLQRNGMALSATLFAAEIQVNGANALDGDWAVVCNGKDVGFEGSVGLEGRAVDGNMDVGGGAEDPVVAGVAVVERKPVGIGFCRDT